MSCVRFFGAHSRLDPNLAAVQRSRVRGGFFSPLSPSLSRAPEFHLSNERHIARGLWSYTSSLSIERLAATAASVAAASSWSISVSLCTGPIRRMIFTRSLPGSDDFKVHNDVRASGRRGPLHLHDVFPSRAQRGTLSLSIGDTQNETCWPHVGLCSDTRAG